MIFLLFMCWFVSCGEQPSKDKCDIYADNYEFRPPPYTIFKADISKCKEGAQTDTEVDFRICNNLNNPECGSTPTNAYIISNGNCQTIGGLDSMEVSGYDKKKKMYSITYMGMMKIYMYCNKGQADVVSCEKYNGYNLELKLEGKSACEYKPSVGEVFGILFGTVFGVILCGCCLCIYLVCFVVIVIAHMIIGISIFGYEKKKEDLMW